MRLMWRSVWLRCCIYFAFMGVFWAAVALAQESMIPVVPDELILKAQLEETVRVIIQIKGSFRPEGKLKDYGAVTFQRKGIAMAQDQLLKEMRNTRHRLFRRFETIPFVAIEAGIHALAVLERSGCVVSVEEDRLSSPMLSESVTLVEGDRAWERGFDGNAWTVAVLDTGVDKTHSFLSGKVVAEACFSGNGSCPNGMITQIGPGSGIACTYAPNGCQHGTHVAGIAAGRGSFFSGVAKGANLISVQVFSRFTGSNCTNAGEDPCTMAYNSDLVAALEHVFKLRTSFQIGAVNMSLSGEAFTSQESCNVANPSTKAAIDNLRSVGIATVAAAGNSGYSNAIGYPACISSAVSVGSVTKTDQISPFSNSASFLSILSPGQNINSSIPGGGFGVKNGTSMAAPHVAGAWAILKQKIPGASADEVLSALQITGLPVTDINNVAKSRIRINRALDLLGGAALVYSAIGVFRPSTGRWYLDDGGGTWSGCKVDKCRGPFGSPNDLAVAADWADSGMTAIGVFRPVTGRWYVDLDMNGIWSGCGLDGCWGPFGGSGDLPVAGNWDGIGKSRIGVFRPSTGRWYLDDGDGIWRGCGTDLCLGPFGSPGDLPVAGDWTNTGTTKIGVYRPGTGMWYLDNGNGTWDGCGNDLCLGPFGSPGDLPVSGDWTNTGTTKIGVYRSITGRWYLDTGDGAWSGCGTDLCLGPFGLPGDYPVAGVW